jgi:diguanylate cyclase (GGDEF)-like protein
MRHIGQQQSVGQQAPSQGVAVDGKSRRRQPLDQALARAASTSQRDLLQALELLQQENTTLREQLRIDHLTGVFNRCALIDELEREWQRWQRNAHPAALLLIDLNDFKRINDKYGHAVGDSALICAADYFSAQLRASDLVARLGGDEFAILLRDTDGPEAQQVATKLCTNAPLLLAAGAVNPEVSAADGDLQLNFAVGAAALTERFGSVHEWLEAADQAMYRHKRERGRHLSCVR